MCTIIFIIWLKVDEGEQFHATFCTILLSESIFNQCQDTVQCWLHKITYILIANLPTLIQLKRFRHQIKSNSRVARPSPCPTTKLLWAVILLLDPCLWALYCSLLLRELLLGQLSAKVRLVHNLISYPDLTLSLEMWDLVKFDFEHAQCQRGPKYGLFFQCACSYSLLWFWVILRNKHGFREYSWRDSLG